MKVCKLIRVNDGNERELRNGGRLFVEEISVTQIIINEFLKHGFEVKHMMSAYTPAMSKPGCYSFYIGGYSIYFEKEVDDMDAYRELEKELDLFVANIATDFEKEPQPSEEEYDFDDYEIIIEDEEYDLFDSDEEE